jgi:hypothetical protein
MSTLPSAVSQSAMNPPAAEPADDTFPVAEPAEQMAWLPVVAPAVVDD